jgi:hypothetical protein
MALLTKGYDPDQDVDLHGFTGSLAAYAATVGVLVAAGALRGRRLPERYAVSDVVLGGIAVHKFSRLVARSSVASPIRAPFTEFEGAAGNAEHDESPRHEHGVRHTIGELLTCPFCLGVWTGTAYIGGIGLAPRAARAWAALFTVTAVSDSLQLAYAKLREA